MKTDRRAEILSRIMACVEIVEADHETPCWLWSRADSGSGRGGGYPRISLNDHTCAAHKVMFVNAYGYVPGNKQIDHKCRNRRCVNPDHLEMVSHKENQKRRDRARRTGGKESSGTKADRPHRPLELTNSPSPKGPMT